LIGLKKKKKKLSAYTATIWAIAGRLGDTIPVLSHGQNVAKGHHVHHARTAFLGTRQHGSSMEFDWGIWGVDLWTQNTKGAPQANPHRVGLDLSNTLKRHVLMKFMPLPA
jgi:hypothetical protein